MRGNAAPPAVDSNTPVWPCPPGIVPYGINRRPRKRQVVSQPAQATSVRPMACWTGNQPRSSFTSSNSETSITCARGGPSPATRARTPNLTCLVLLHTLAGFAAEAVETEFLARVEETVSHVLGETRLRPIDPSTARTLRPIVPVGPCAPMARPVRTAPGLFCQGSTRFVTEPAASPSASLLAPTALL